MQKDVVWAGLAGVWAASVVGVCTIATMATDRLLLIIYAIITPDDVSRARDTRVGTPPVGRHHYH